MPMVAVFPPNNLKIQVILRMFVFLHTASRCRQVYLPRGDQLPKGVLIYQREIGITKGRFIFSMGRLIYRQLTVVHGIIA